MIPAFSPFCHFPFSLICHSERSEESAFQKARFLTTRFFRLRLRMTTERFTRNDNVRFCSGLSVVVGAASHAAWRGRQDCPHPALSQRAREKRQRRLLAPFPGACGRGFAPVPKPIWGRGLSERSEFRSPNLRDWGKGTRRATPGRQWFWVLLPKQKDLGVRGRNPANPSPLVARGRNPASIPPLVVLGRNPACSRKCPLNAPSRRELYI